MRRVQPSHMYQLGVIFSPQSSHSHLLPRRQRLLRPRRVPLRCGGSPIPCSRSVSSHHCRQADHLLYLADIGQHLQEDYRKEKELVRNQFSAKSFILLLSSCLFLSLSQAESAPTKENTATTRSQSRTLFQISFIFPPPSGYSPSRPQSLPGYSTALSFLLTAPAVSLFLLRAHPALIHRDHRLRIV